MKAFPSHVQYLRVMQAHAKVILFSVKLTGLSLRLIDIYKTSGQCFKCFAIVIYDFELRFSLQHTLQALFMLLAKGKLARIIVLLYWPYDRIVLTTLNDDCNTFIVQATG